jgi:hypothetical protein
LDYLAAPPVLHEIDAKVDIIAAWNVACMTSHVPHHRRAYLQA